MNEFEKAVAALTDADVEKGVKAKAAKPEPKARPLSDEQLKVAVEKWHRKINH